MKDEKEVIDQLKESLNQVAKVEFAEARLLVVELQKTMNDFEGLILEIGKTRSVGLLFLSC